MNCEDFYETFEFFSPKPLMLAKKTNQKKQKSDEMALVKPV